MVNNILNELQERNKQLLEENKALKKRFDVMKMNNLTEQEIREIIGSLNSNPDEGHIKAIKDYFEFRPHELQHLGDKGFRKSFVLRIYMHQNAMSWWVKANEEVKSLQKEKNELVEKNLILEKVNQELEQKEKELEIEVEELGDEVQMEQEEAEKVLNTAMKWRKWQMTEVVEKYNMGEKELLDQISMLERSLLNEQQKTSYWRSKNQELPALPKQQKENRLWKFKQLVSKVKEKTKEKFQTFIVQKNN